MIEIKVTEHESKPTKVLAVLWTGDPDDAKLLQREGWIEGADQGFNRANDGDFVLRARCMSKQGMVLAFPGDYIIKLADDDIYPCDPTVFAERYQEGQIRELLQDELVDHSLDTAEPTAGVSTQTVEPEPDADLFPGHNEENEAARRAADAEALEVDGGDADADEEEAETDSEEDDSEEDTEEEDSEV